MLSEDTIPSVKGEWYNYCSNFTPDRPLGYLMKCKANKNRSLRFIQQNSDVDLVFIFGNRGVQLCSPDSREARKAMRGFDADVKTFNATLFAKVNIGDMKFDTIRDVKDQKGLIIACSENMTTRATNLRAGMIIAVTTPTGKYCLMRVTDLRQELVRVECCHILL